jgi:prevent-host-death family protein
MIRGRQGRNVGGSPRGHPGRTWRRLIVQEPRPSPGRGVKVDASKVRNDFRRQLDKVAQGEHIPITRWGEPVAVLVPNEWYERARLALGEDAPA